MKVKQVSVSFPSDLHDEIRAAADRSGQSLSAWFEEAAQARIRREALGVALAEYQIEHGEFNAEELARAGHAAKIVGGSTHVA